MIAVNHSARAEHHARQPNKVEAPPVSVCDRGQTPLQVLALYAHDHFGEDGFPYEDSVPSSFDVIVEVYAREADSDAGDEVHVQARTAVIDRLHGRQESIAGASPAVDAYVEEVLSYLRGQYPEASQAAEERGMLSNLFWGNLVASRRAG